MASREPLPVREYVETGLEPEFNVNHITHEYADGGMVRIFCWKWIHSKYVLQYTAVVPGTALVQMGRQCIEIGTDAFNVLQFKDEMTSH